MTEQEFEERYARYNKDFNRHQWRWAVTFFSPQLVLIYFGLRFEDSIPDAIGYFLLLLLFAGYAFSIYYELRFDKKLRESYDFTCPSCRVLFNRVMLRRIRYNDRCPACKRHVIRPLAGSE